MSNYSKIQDYVEVKDRIKSFYEKFPQGAIITEIISWNDCIIVMKATIYRNPDEQAKGIVAATGHAYEKEGSSQVNKFSALENAETSCVGRGLAILGFDIRKSVASKDEMANALHKQAQNATELTCEQQKDELNGNIPESENECLRMENRRSDEPFADHTSFERKRFFAICKKKGLTDKQQKAIVYLFTNKLSRKDLGREEFELVNNKLQNANRDTVLNMIRQAVELKLSG